jgi:multidrug efflux pump subunit AcrA (membrane-fusion protein)
MTELDLRALALDRRTLNHPQRAHRRAVFSRYVLPGVVIFGFLAMLGWAARDQFLSAKPVTVVPVVVTRAEVHQAAAPLFQAAGWVEPRPTPMLVSALAEGVLDQLLVVEGQQIEANQPVARLIDADAKLALEQARAALALRTAELASAEADFRAARLRLEHPVHLQSVLAEAQSLLAKTETELASLPFLIQAADARVEFARQNLAGKQGAGEALAGRLVQQAQREYDIALAEWKELQARTPRLEREADALRQRRDALARQLELLIDETRQAAGSEAQVAVAEGRKRQAELEVQAAQLRLERMVVRSPAAGRVLSLVARPGSRVMGIEPAGEQKANTIITLYDPQMLQVRADVRLEDVPLVQPGQPVRIETASASEPILGNVLHATSQADIQKNTLEVKVAITMPPATIRPEMLVTATFLAPEQPDAESQESEQRERLLAPRQLVESTDDGHTLWVADPSGVARRRRVRLGNAGTDALVEVVEGLRPTDRLISGGRERLDDGDRVTITGEDGSLGMTSRARRRQPDLHEFSVPPVHAGLECRRPGDAARGPSDGRCRTGGGGPRHRLGPPGRRQPQPDARGRSKPVRSPIWSI